MSKRLYYHLSTLDESDSAEIAFDQDGNEVDASKRVRVETLEEANLISSLCDDGLHMPVLDVDTMEKIPAVISLCECWRKLYRNWGLKPDEVRIADSTTPGHFHIYVDVPMEWSDYELLLDYLDDATVIEQGYYRAAVTRKATFVRPPGVLKPTESKRKVRRGYRFEMEVV